MTVQCRDLLNRGVGVRKEKVKVDSKVTPRRCLQWNLSIEMPRRITQTHLRYGLPQWLTAKESACQCRRHRRHGFDPWIGKQMTTDSSILSGKIPWTEEPGGLQSMRSRRVGHGGVSSSSTRLSHLHA